MANTCNVEYIVRFERVGDAKEFQKLVEMEVFGAESSCLGWNFRKIVSALGGDPDSMSLRGDVCNVGRTECDVHLHCNTAWVEQADFRHFIEETYDCSVLYFAEEPGCEYFETNNPDCWKYRVDADGEIQYFDTQDEVVDNLSGYGVKCWDDVMKLHDSECSDVWVYEINCV